MLLWLGLASLALASLTSPANGAPLHVLAAPNKLHVGTEENIFVEVQDYTGSDDLKVIIQVLNYPTKNRQLGFINVILTREHNYQQLAKIKIPMDGFNTNPNITQYVVVQALFPGRTLEKVVMASLRSGYIFIQTDKTIYTPNSDVHYRMFAVTPGMDPFNGTSHEGGSVTVEIVNPDGFTFMAAIVYLTKGINSGKYLIPDITSLGLWKVVAKFTVNPQEIFAAEFEVSKYVLPTFEVKLDPEGSFFYVDTEEFEVGIKANYMYGEPVIGNAFVVFGVIEGEHKRSFPGSLEKIPVVKGVAKATLKREDITENLTQLAETGSSIYVFVTVLTDSGSEMVEAEARGIHIVTSPYIISFKKSAKYFKPGMALDVLVQVMNPDKTPAVNVPVLVNPGGLESSTDDNGMAKFGVNIPEAVGSSLQIHATTKMRDIREDRQTQATMRVESYRPINGSNNYLHLGVEKSGNVATINFHFGKLAISNHGVTYLILSKGQIVDSGHLLRGTDLVMKKHVSVSKLMLPSFRVVAYYHASDTEVVSDSVLVYVKETCMGSLKIELEDPEDFKPGGKIRLKVTGDKGARVGLVAVDKAVYVLNNKHRLTQKKVWGVMDSYDTGCTPGGGRNAMGVFYDAGLMFQSSTASGTSDRTDKNCPVGARRRRAAANIANARTSLVSGYTGELQRRCCLDGMRDTPLSYNCQRRSEYIQDGPECKAAFLHCCEQLASQRAEHRDGLLILARTGEDFGDSDKNDWDQFNSRTYFPESWLWKDIDLPADCPKRKSCETTTHIDPIKKERHLPDSITTWQISGVSLSADHGICVSQPLEVVVKKPFFVDLRLPYSAIRGEQVEIRAILHNLKSEPLYVTLELYDIKGVCSVASKRRKHTMRLMVGARTTRAVPFILIPLTEGQHQIEVKVFVPSLLYGDGIVRKLLVEPIGVLSRHSMTLPLDPRGGEQKENVYNIIPETERVVPGGKTRTVFSVTGGTQLSDLVEGALSGKAMERFITEPRGCGEQNIGSMTFPLIAATYLDKAQKWQDVGFSQRDKTLSYIRTGYTKQLAYRSKSGCFYVWRDGSAPCTTWLTAYVVKVFAMARNLHVTLEDNVICDAVKWLILKAQQPDGIFKEIGRMYDPKMAMPSSINKAVDYLERRLPRLQRSYAAAITSYALANEGKLNKDILFKFAAAGRERWPVDGGVDFSREATGYALLALVKAQAFEEAKPIVKWLNTQRPEGLGYGSSQVTMVVYQALAEYWGNVQEEPFNLTVQINVEGRANIDRWNFDKANSYTTRSSKVNGIKSMNVTAIGSGEATLSVVSLYYALPITKPGDCEKFNLEVKFALEKQADSHSGDIYKLEIDILYKDMNEDAKMTVLDISLPTGFIPDNNDLDRLTKGVDRAISRYEIDSLQSAQKGSVIIYLDQVSRVRPDQIAFHLIQTIKVGVLQPAAVSVYEYYNKKPCVKFYHPNREKGDILRLCQDDNTCVCAEESCSKQKKDKITNPNLAYAERLTMACNTEGGSNNKTDYAYKVRVEHFLQDQTVDVYQMRIEEVLKEGTDKGKPPQGMLGVNASFVSFPHCRQALALEETKTYLIMGLSDDLFFNKDKDKYEYSIGERTWLEYWPTAIECQSKEYRSLCLALKKVKDQLEIFGCVD